MPPTLLDTDLERMREALLFDGPTAGRKLTRFWVLLVLAAVIAAAGIVADSTATVIGAMIVAPLMVPILGTVLSIVTADLPNLARSVAMVAGGALLVVAVGWLLGWVTAVDVVAATNAQVSGRVHPRLIDLVAALATGAVGAFALVRSDVSDTLPGVAIAISLVPPLAVVGLTLQAGEADEALGAGLLFLTNVGAILLTGLIVMALYRVRTVAAADGAAAQRSRRVGSAVVVAAVVVLAVPLAAGSQRFTSESLQRSDVTAVAEDWAGPSGWRIVNVDTDPDGVVVYASGRLPAPEPAELRALLDAAGLRSVDVRLEMVPVERVSLPGD